MQFDWFEKLKSESNPRKSNELLRRDDGRW